MLINDSIKKVCFASFEGCFLKNVYDGIAKENLLEVQFESWWAVNEEQILKICHANVKGLRIKIVPVTGLVNLIDGSPAPGLKWSAYRNWTGWIVKEIMNGDNEAYVVKISNNNVSYIQLNINKTDIRFLSDNED